MASARARAALETYEFACVKVNERQSCAIYICYWCFTRNVERTFYYMKFEQTLQKKFKRQADTSYRLKLKEALQ